VRDSCGISVTGETPNGAKRRGGSPHTPWKASILERKSTTLKGNKVCENSIFINIEKTGEARLFYSSVTCTLTVPVTCE
jgi:hypothetical protein